MPTICCHSTGPLGTLLLAAREGALIGAWFLDQRHFPKRCEDWRESPQDGLLRAAASQLEEWFAGTRQGFDLPLAPIGTPFQQAVWREIARVPFGQTQTYGEVARALGRPKASRAVGAATGSNPLSIIIPCHRLVASDGALTGYDGGLARKAALLRFERGECGATSGKRVAGQRCGDDLFSSFPVSTLPCPRPSYRT